MWKIFRPKKKMISGKPSSAQMSNEIESFEFYYKLASLYIKTFEEIQIQKLTCYKQNCHEKVLFECKCLAHATFICQTHIGTHLIEGISQRHVPIVLNPEIYDQK